MHNYIIKSRIFKSSLLIIFISVCLINNLHLFTLNNFVDLVNGILLLHLFKMTDKDGWLFCNSNNLNNIIKCIGKKQLILILLVDSY